MLRYASWTTLPTGGRWRAWTADLDDRMTSIISFLIPPPEFELGDRVLMLVGFAWTGADHAEGEAVVAPLRVAVQPDVEMIEPARWVEWQSAFDFVLPKGIRAYWKNAFFEKLTDEFLDALIEVAGSQTSLGTGTDLHHMGGAFGRVAEDATPFPNRSAGYWLNMYANWYEPAEDDQQIAWVRGLHAATAPFSMGGAYVNAVAPEQARGDAQRQILAIYGPAKLERLKALKRKYDPDNLFRLNHNIRPD